MLACSCAVLFWIASSALQALAQGPALSQGNSSSTPQTVSPSSQPDPSAAEPSCEQHLLGLLGWQSAYDPAGYVISTDLPGNLTADSWSSLGCLRSLTHLTLTGSIPDLPDAWATNGSFPVLQSLNFAASNIAGSLPDSWGQLNAFQKLQALNLSFTHLSGTLPATWAQPEAFPALTELDLSATSINGRIPANLYHKQHPANRVISTTRLSLPVVWLHALQPL